MSDFLNKKVSVGDAGHVILIDYMGDDNSIAEAARVSYNKNSTKSVRDNENLIRYLMRNQHYSPFGQAVVKIAFRMPIFVFAQFVRHDRFTFNMESGRYSVLSDEKWRPNSWRMPSSTNKQAGDKDLPAEEQDYCFSMQEKAYSASSLLYKDLLNSGVCREQARSVLPVGQYTEGVATANLGDWLLMLKQRLDHHAQFEIQEYAMEIFKIIDSLFPVTAGAFLDYQHNAKVFSAMEMRALQDILANNIKIFNLSAEERIALLSKHGLSSKRERVEFFQKIRA